MAKVVINVNMFDMYQTIYYVENDKPIRNTSVFIDEIIPFVLYNDQWNIGIEEIDINGNSQFIKKIGKDFITKLQNQFSNKNVRILINGEVLN